MQSRACGGSKMSRVVVDDRRCVGCLTCVVSCLDHHYPDTAVDAVPLRIYRRMVFPSGLVQYCTDSCRHCSDAPCMAVCPAGALHRDEYGFVQINRDACIGCQACARACPYGIPRFGSDGKMVKCDGCAGQEPACVSSCKRGALKIDGQ